MDNLMELVVGPLAGPECRHSLGRRWLTVVRTLSGLSTVGIVLIVVWAWWFYAQLGFQLSGLLIGALATIEGVLITIALVLSPALVSGALTKEKTQGMLEMLLASRVSTYEIVAGRFAGSLAMVGMILLAGLPGLIFIAGLCGLGPWQLGWLVALPLAVAFGAGGLGIGMSAVAYRGRDALMAAYLVILMLLMAPMIGLYLAPASRWNLLALANPFLGIATLSSTAEVNQVVVSTGLWMLLGVLGAGCASWRVRANYLRDSDAGITRRRARRRQVLPPMGDRPMLWKELHVERLAPFSRFVRWMLLVVIVVVLGISLALGATIVWSRFIRPDSNWDMWAMTQLAALSTLTSTPVSWLIQWAIGLRAAVAVASERERATWDALLISPLEGPEIVRAKFMGSLYALRGLIAAVAIAWTVQLMCGATDMAGYWTLMGNTLAVSTFMAAVGVACSLSISSATRAMASAVGIWLAAAAASAVLAGLLVMVLMLVIFVLSLIYTALFETGGQMVASVTPLIFASFGIVWVVVRLSLYLLSALLIWQYCRRRFDVLAGRVPVASVGPSRRPIGPRPIGPRPASERAKPPQA